MKRLAALALAASAALAAGLVLGPGHLRAGEKDKDVEKVEKRVIVRSPGGSWLGVSLADTDADRRGAKVRSVEDGSPAEKAGIRGGDVIVRFDGETVRSASQLARLVRETPAGRTVAIEVTRDGGTQKLSATLAEGSERTRALTLDLPDLDIEVPPVPSPPHAPLPPGPHVFSWRGDDGRDLVFRMFGGGPRKLGIEYMEMGEQLAAYFKLGDRQGVLVTSVEADGPAGKAGMKAGDVVLKFDGKAIGDGSDLREAVSEAEGGAEVTITVQRDGRPMDLRVTLAKPEPRVRRRSVGIGT